MVFTQCWCRLNRGVVELITDYNVCKAGQRLTSDQAAILRVFHVRMSSFRFTPVAHWEKEGDMPQTLHPRTLDYTWALFAAVHLF